MAEKMDTAKFEQAKEKVLNNDALSAHADFILSDWPEGNDHWDWVLESSDEEILDWVAAGSDE